MNILDTNILSRLQDVIAAMKLTAGNAALASRYLSDPDEPDEILKDAEHQEHFRNMSRQDRNVLAISVHRLDGAGYRRMDRVLKFLWAVGGSSICILVASMGMGYLFHGDCVEFRVKALGKARAAAMESCCYETDGSYHEQSLIWLCDLAQEDPQALVDAVEFGEPGMFLMLGVLFALAPEKMDEKRLSLLRTFLLNRIPKILFGLPAAEIQAMVDYVTACDVTAELPILPSIPVPAVDIASAREAIWRERHYLKGFAIAALLGADQSKTMRCALRFSLMLYPRLVFRTAYLRLPGDLFTRVLPLLKEEMPGCGASLLLASASCDWEKGNREHLWNFCQEDVSAAVEAADAWELAQFIEQGFRFSVEDIRLTVINSYCADQPQELRERVRAFLTDDTGDLSAAPNLGLNEVGDCRNTMRLLRHYVDLAGMDVFSLRCVALSILYYHDPEMRFLCWKGGDLDGARLTKVMQGLASHGMPMEILLAICAKTADDVWEQADKLAARQAVVGLAQYGQAEDFARAFKKGTVFLRGAVMECLDHHAADPAAKEAILSAAGDSSKAVRELAAVIWPKHPEWVEDYKALLNAKKAAVRQLAAQALGALGEMAALEEALTREKNAAVAEAIRSALGSTLTVSVGSVSQLAATLTGGNQLKKLSWLLSDTLPKLRNTDGTPADDKIRDAILLSYCNLGRIGRSDTAAQLAEGLDVTDLQNLAAEVYETWYAAGAQAKHKWVLPFAAVFGGSNLTQRLHRCIQDWPNYQRGAIACDAVMALALSPDPAAIVLVDAISRKFKFRQVKQAAAAALDRAAQELGITAEELADRIVPDLGFGADGKRVFDYGKRSFTVRLTPTLELEITNDQGKTVKNMPAPGKTDDEIAAAAYDEFKTMKKQIKTTVTAQRARLENALSALRCWDVERWQALFVKNPIMHQFAISLIWGVYEEGKLTDTFRYMEDGSFNTADEDEYTLPENARIGLVHPIELDSETLEAWKQQLEDYEITQSIDQLGRPVFALEEGKAAQKSLEDFGGKKINVLSLSGKMLGQGWYRGSVQDGGFFSCFYREDRELGIGAELRFSGCAVGYADEEPVTVYEAIFYRGTINRGSYVYDEVPAENIVPLGEVPARYYSEIVHQLRKATASSTETDENWRASRNER